MNYMKLAGLAVASINKKQVFRKALTKSEDQQIVHCVVIEPETKVTEDGDAHGHVMSAEEIEKTAHTFMMGGAKIKIQHKGKPVTGIKVIETFIAPVEYEVNGETIKKGTWVIALKITSKRIWKMIKEGKFTGVSPGGFGVLVDEK